MFLVIYQNRERFDLEDYESFTPIKRESIVTWTPLPFKRLQKTFFIKRNYVEREDNMIMSVPGITTWEEEFYSVYEHT